MLCDDLAIFFGVLPLKFGSRTQKIPTFHDSSVINSNIGMKLILNYIKYTLFHCLECFKCS